MVPVSGDYPLVYGNLIFMLQLGLFCLVFWKWSRLGDVMKAQPRRKWPQALTAAPYYDQITPRCMQVGCNNTSVGSSLLYSQCVSQNTDTLDPGAETATDMAAHQEPQVAPQSFPHLLEFYCIRAHSGSTCHNNFWNCSSLICTTNTRGITVFINFCMHMCIHVCVWMWMRVTQRDARLPIDVIIFSFQALIAAWLLRYFYYSVCVLREREWKRERERRREERWGGLCLVCAYVWVGVSQSGSQKVPDTFQCFLAGCKTIPKVSFPAKTWNLWNKKSYGASSVILWWELVWICAKNTSSHFAEEQHFDLGLCSMRVEQVYGYRPGWVEWDDIINYITQRLLGILLSNCQIEAAQCYQQQNRQRHLISPVFPSAPRRAAWSLHPLQTWAPISWNGLHLDSAISPAVQPMQMWQVPGDSWGGP